MALPLDKDIDPVALLDALLKAKHGVPGALDQHYGSLIAVMARYWQGQGPRSPGSPANPIASIRRNIVIWTRRRAVESIRAWKEDHLLFQDMPGPAIDRWFQGKIKLPLKPNDRVIEEAEQSLAATEFEATFGQIKAATASKHRNVPDPPTREFCALLGIPHPSSVFCGPTVQMPLKIKQDLEWQQTGLEFPRWDYQREEERRRLRIDALPDDHPMKVRAQQDEMRAYQKLMRPFTRS